jgi:hypothetical protein
MATTLLIEERGTCTGRVHPHNGYYAGDFSRADQSADPAAPSPSHRLRLLPAATSAAAPDPRPLTRSTYAA